MGFALGLTGWWMYIDVPATPQAVVACVIVFNAAFGYRYGYRRDLILTHFSEAGDQFHGCIPLRWATS